MKIKKIIGATLVTVLLTTSIACTFANPKDQNQNENGEDPNAPRPEQVQGNSENQQRAEHVHGEDDATKPQRRESNKDDETLTDSQILMINEILASYDANALTQEDAIEMNERFRDAGIRGGRPLSEVITLAGFDTEEIRTLAPPKGRDESNATDNDMSRPNDEKKDDNQNPVNDRPVNEPNSNSGQVSDKRYSIDQAISDHAQLNTIAFDGLAFLTGNLGSDSSFPPGKVSDFFGFQYLRDVDAGEQGHSSQFLTKIANNMFYVLTDEQIAKLDVLAKEQVSLISDYAYKRFPLMSAFRRLEGNDIPSGSTELNVEAVADFSSELYEIDGQMSLERAEVMGEIINSLSDSQRTYLDEMVAGDSSTWTEFATDQLDKKSYSHSEHVAMMTYASEMFSWYAGDLESDTYFCPERQGNYFGAFYIKSSSVAGSPNESIDTTLTGNSGEMFLEILSVEQRLLIEDLIDNQRDELLELVQVRREIASELRVAQNGNVIDEEKVMALSREYGALDGRISHSYATAFAKISDTLTDNQINKLVELRNTDTVEGAFLYSEKIDIPNIINTDFLFK